MQRFSKIGFNPILVPNEENDCYAMEIRTINHI